MPRVLLLDDDPLVAKAHALWLRRSGLQRVETCTDPRTALERIQGGERFDVVVCDGQMIPGLDGVDFYLQAVIAWPALRRRIVFLSGGLSQDDLRFVQEQGFPYFRKPLDQAQTRALADTLRRLGLATDGDLEPSS